MANISEITFGNLQMDERFKKLERSLKLALLKKQYRKNINTEEVSPMVTSPWPSISTINVDTLDSSCMTQPLQTSLAKSEILTSSSNLRNMFLKKKNYNTNQEVIATSSIKQCDVQKENIDQLLTPPPTMNILEAQNGRYKTLNYKKAASTLLNSSVQSSPVNIFSSENTPSCISTNTNTGKEYFHFFAAPITPVDDCQKIDRVFSKWRVMLNDQYELIIKGTLECGKLARSKPVIIRHTATCVESKYKHKYSLLGTIVDERNVLPDYIRGKFYNGFPDDWENVYQIWRTYISQGSPVTFRWPTPITDSDDDLKSELTEFTCMRNDKIIPLNESYELTEHTRISENASNKSLKEEGKCHNCSSRNLQSYEKNTPFTKPFISNSEKDIIPMAQTKNIKSGCDEVSEQNVKSNINTPCSSRKVNKLQDILQEDKLNIIINNLADKNCSPKYIDKIIEMFDYLNYAISYTGSKYDHDSVVSANPKTQKSMSIPHQRNFTCDDNSVNTDKLGNRTTVLKNYMHSTDLGSIKNDSNSTQLLNPVNIERDDSKDSDKSESEIYTGVPKISIERILKKNREAPKEIHRCKVRKKNYPDPQICEESCVSLTEDEMKSTNTKQCHKITNIQRPQETFSSHQELQRNNSDVYRGKKLVTPIIDIKKSLPFDESCVSITEDEVEMTNMKKHHKTTNIIQRPQAMTLFSHQEIQRDDLKVYGKNTESVTRVQNERPLDTFKIQNFPTKDETPTQQSKPTIISSMPVNPNLKIYNADSKSGQPHDSDVSIIETEDKQCTNIRPLEETHKKKSVSEAIISDQYLTAAIPVVIANDSHPKVTADNKKEVHPITNNKDELNIDPINSTKSMTNATPEQSKSNKVGVGDNPKVLTAWIPKVVYSAKSKSELGLTFEGKLLNEAGHVMHRKFTTDIVLKRISAILIETVNHEYYKLLGHLNDNKHVIPRELAMQCRNGCPAKIEQFCLTWEKLQQKHKIEEKLALVDSLNISVSSRGRRRLPPLSFWTDERITVKDNNPVYNPGNSQESLLTLSTENSKEILDIEEKKKKKEDSKSTSKKQIVNKQKSLFESNEASGTNRNQTIIEKTRSSNKSPKSKAASNTRSSDNSREYRKSAVNAKRRIQQTFSSNDSSEEEQETFPRKRVRKFQPTTNVDAEMPSRYTLRKRQKVEVSPNRTSPKNATKRYTAYLPTKKSYMTCAYFQNVPLREDFLSENELSTI